MVVGIGAGGDGV